MEWLANLLVKTGIAAFGESFFKPYLQHLDNRDTVAAGLAARELAVEEVETQAQAQLKIAEIGHWYEPEKLFAYVILFYFAKVYIYDAAFGLGSTDAVRGAAADWAGMIMVFYFGKRGVENVFRILKR